MKSLIKLTKSRAFSNATSAVVQYLSRLTVVSPWTKLYCSTPVLYGQYIHQETYLVLSQCKVCIHDYLFNSSITEMLQRMNWSNLCSCQHQLKVLIMFRIVHNFIDIPLSHLPSIYWAIQKSYRSQPPELTLIRI